MKMDNLHYNFNTIDGYQKPFMAVISPREAGKSTSAWLQKIYPAFKKYGRPSIILRRRIADITKSYIDDTQEVLNKFLDEPVEFEYMKGDIKNGIVDIKIKGQLFVRVLALSVPMSRTKSGLVKGIKYFMFDEFICNPKFGEKYLKDEATIFREVFNTYQRESEDVQCIFLGNPYSLYNPYFTWWGVDTQQLHPGSILQGNNWVIQAYQLKPELRDYILARNPLYQFDDSYRSYAFDGTAVNDANIRILPKLPENYKLHLVFKINDTFIGLYRNRAYDHDNEFWAGEIEYVGEKRQVYCFDFDEMVQGTVLASIEERIKFQSLKSAIRFRRVQYESIGISYMLEEIYKNL